MSKQDWKELRQWLLIIFVAAAILTVLAFGARGLGLISFKLFGAAEESTRREVFETSKAYRDGMAQELRSMQADYIQAKPEHQAGLRSLILHRAAGVPADALPPDLAAWINQLLSENAK